jgi:hypothetical protein
VLRRYAMPTSQPLDKHSAIAPSDNQSLLGVYMQQNKNQFRNVGQLG